ncbi:hypothetical protein LINGRAHAP2_LOCUS10866 [Linum grandiflorum]
MHRWTTSDCTPSVRLLQKVLSISTLCRLRWRICGSRVKVYQSLTKVRV